jgi:hypothetical protein
VRVAAHPIPGAVAQLDDVEDLVDPGGGAIAVEGGQQLQVLPPA